MSLPDLKQEDILFSQFVDLRMMRTREYLESLTKLYGFPHASNLLVSKQFTPMSLAHTGQMTYIPRGGTKAFIRWLTRKLEDSPINDYIVVVENDEQKGWMLSLCQEQYRAAAEKCIYTNLDSHEGFKIKTGTGDLRLDINRVYYVSPTESTLGDFRITRLLMNLFDDNDLHKTGLEIAVFV